MITYVRDSFTRLEGIGYQPFKAENPKMTIKPFQRNLFPPRLQAEMAKVWQMYKGIFVCYVGRQ